MTSFSTENSLQWKTPTKCLSVLSKFNTPNKNVSADPQKWAESWKGGSQSRRQISGGELRAQGGGAYAGWQGVLINTLNVRYKEINNQMAKLLLVLGLVALCLAAPIGDLIPQVPGYPKNLNFSVYSGYLSTGDTNRGLHYVFVSSINGDNNKDPVTLWLNGGPGCSSMLGFIQEIGPYVLPDGVSYKKEDNLTENPHSWNKASNLLFIESPAGVGYSYNLDKDLEFNDTLVANDTFNAVLDFFSKFGEYRNNSFWIAGESYAGKYIPDLTVLLDKHNLRSPPNPVSLRGFLIGNGVMDFRGGSLYDSQVDYMVKHDFVDPDLLIYWQVSCKLDPNSAGCNYFIKRYEDNIFELNPYNVYDYCYYNDSFVAGKNATAHKKHLSQESILRELVRSHKFNEKPKFNGAPCAFFDGIYYYFNTNEEQFHAKFTGMEWNGPCAENVSNHYTIDLAGSISAYRYLLTRTHVLQMVLYNGESDSVVPYVDTIKNLYQLNLKESYLYTPWFTNDQHSGFQMVYSGIVWVTFKGAGHMVPQNKRADAYNLFKQTLDGHPGFQQQQQ